MGANPRRLVDRREAGRRSDGHDRARYRSTTGTKTQLELDGEPRWWLDHIKTRLSRHLPFPADKDARERLLYRVAMELFGTPYNDDAFVADQTPGAFDALALRLFHRPGQHAWAGPLESAPTKFRVLPADPAAAKKPRTAKDPGRYTLGENVRLIVTRRPDGERIVNEGSVTYFPPGKDSLPHDLKLPDGYDTWAAAWVKDTTVLWVSQKGLLRKIDFTEPAKVEETRYAADKADAAPIPADIREALRAALAVPDAPKQIETPLPPAAIAPAASEPKQQGAEATLPPDDRDHARPKLPDNAYARTGIPVTALKWQVLPAWGEAKDGLQVGIRVNGEASIGGKVLVELWITNSGKEDVRFVQCGRIDVGLRVMAKDKSGKDHSAEIPGDRSRPVFHGIQLPPGHITKLKEFALDLKSEAGAPPSAQRASLTVLPGDYKLRVKWSDSDPLGLTSGEVNLKIAAANTAAGLKGADARITPESLVGFWRGALDGEAISISFHRPPVGADVQGDIYFGEAKIPSLARCTISADGGSVLVVMDLADSATFGTLRPGEAGTLKLELHNRQKGQTESGADA